MTSTTQAVRTPSTSQICIYHGNCADGFGAAWVVRKALGDIEFHSGKYQEPPPDVAGYDVVLVDFSYKRPVLLEMAAVANSILILDHHKTAVEDLVDLPANVTTKFDMGHSGAILTWEHFFPGQQPPPLLLHIEDRDLWRFTLQNTRQIQANVFSFPYDFRVWDALMAAAPAILAAEGEAIERKHFKDMRELLGVTTREMIIGGHRVPVANLPYTMSSDAGHELAKGRPFAACYMDTAKGRVFSLRSNDEGVDVAEVAKQYGGGGHRNAAGFTVTFATGGAFEAAHPDDIAIDALAAAMKAKMAITRGKGRSGWDDKEQCPDGTLAPMLLAAVAKGDPIDVANFAMMLFARGEQTAATALIKPEVGHSAVEDTKRLDWLEHCAADLRTTDFPAGLGDTSFTVIQRLFADSGELELGRGQTAREAIDAAREALGSAK